MADFIVDTTADTVDAHDGVLSLREALAQADRSDGADTIRFSDQVQGGTIVLAGSQLTVASEVTVDGGSGVTIDADQRSRVLLVEEPEGDNHAWVTLSHLTITDGRTRGGGGGIYSQADYDSLRLDHVNVTGNRATGVGGGISGFYDTDLSDCIVAGNRAAGSGGGIAGYYVSVANSTISDNQARGDSASGGGIAAGEHVWLSNSTVSGNSAIGGDASGGGIFSLHLFALDSTVSGNQARGAGASGGGLDQYFGYARLYGSTVTGNRAVGAGATGGGIDAGDYGNLYAHNSIVAGNSATGSGAADVDGSVLSNGTNIFGSEVAGSLPSDAQSVAANVLFAAVDPATGGGLLADNGGSTWTIALRDAVDNPALGHADPNAPYASPTDQRGVARPLPDGTNPDIGAFELDQSDPRPPGIGTTFVVTSTADTVADDGVLTLREALALADADNLTADRIEFASQIQGQTILLGGSELTIHSDVTIDGGGVTINASGASRVLSVEGLDADVTLRQLTVTGGRTSDETAQGGAGIYARDDTTLALYGVSVVGNHSGGSGGGIRGDAITLINSTVSGNSTTGFFSASGGGISGGEVILINSQVEGNSTAGPDATGGGIDAFSVKLVASTVCDNSTAGDLAPGGGIHGQYVNAVNSTISGNSTAGNGEIIFTTIYSSAGGGGIYGDSVVLVSSTVTGNSTGGYYAGGGGIATSSTSLPRLSISNSIVAGNAAAGSPGADVSGAIGTSNGHNIFGSDVAGNVAGDLENVAPGLLFAALEPATGGGLLADHGGPTWTIALRDAVDNPALGGADPADAPATDQRGEVRPQPEGTNPDVGAFELGPAPLNPIDGTVAADVLRGTAVGDLIRGLPGADLLWGFAGDDQLIGGYGDDVLVGGPGIDRMQGGMGVDRFVFREAAAAPPAGPTYDEILGFVRAERDVIDLRPIDARAGQPGDQAFELIGREAFTGGGQLRYEATAGGGFLVQGNTDADLAADFAFVVHTGLANLKEVDFLL
ncbi:MAG: choice-of-anchor Q domain-containing protein [Geminicoccaceae bacterium]